MRSKVLYGLILLILCGSFSKSRAQGTEEVSSKGTDFWIASTYPFYSNDSFLIAVSSSKPTRAYMSIPGFNIYDSLELGYNEIKYFVVPSSIRRSYYYYRQNGGGSLNNKIGENCIIAGQVGFAGSSTLGNNVMIGGQAGISGHLKVGSNVQIGGGSGVIKNIPDNSKVMGYPAKNLKNFIKDNK